jgi:hypothetical protein
VHETEKLLLTTVRRWAITLPHSRHRTEPLERWRLMPSRSPIRASESPWRGASASARDVAGLGVVRVAFLTVQELNPGGNLLICRNRR